MAGKSVTHSEDWWASAPPNVLRCNGQYKTTGLRCRREGLPGTSVCREHGGLSPATRAAATRIQMTSDEAARSLIQWMNDDKIDMRERVKIAQDLLDRGGLSGAQTVKLMPITEDPIEALFKSLLNDDGLLPADAPPTRSYDSELADILGNVEHHVVEDAVRKLPPAASAPARKALTFSRLHRLPVRPRPPAAVSLTRCGRSACRPDINGRSSTTCRCPTNPMKFTIRRGFNHENAAIPAS